MSTSIGTQNPWAEENVQSTKRRWATKKTKIILAICHVSLLIVATVTCSVWFWFNPIRSEGSSNNETLVTTQKSISTTSTGPEQPYNINMCRIDSCGQTGPNYVATRIAGGRYTRKDEFPFHVAFSFPPDWFNPIWCGGSMINDRWILTSAHCLIGETVADIRVSIGVLDASEVAESAIEIENYWIHPNFTEGVSRNHDIALVRTSKSIKESSKNFVSPICLPFEDIEAPKATAAKVSGFGRTQDHSYSNKSLTASLNILPDDLCQKMYTESPKIFNSTFMICAGDLKGEQDTCYSDTGNPLMVKNKNGSYVLKGITSFGSSHGVYECKPEANSPGVYTKVSPYLNWICETMFDNKLN